MAFLVECWTSALQGALGLLVSRMLLGCTYFSIRPAYQPRNPKICFVAGRRTPGSGFDTIYDVRLHYYANAEVFSLSGKR
jgi:hypothetical protein